AILGALVGERDVGVAVVQAELGEELAQAHARLLAPAVLLEERAADVVVERSGGPAQAQPVLLTPEAAGLDLRRELARFRAAPRDDVDGAPQRVASEQCRRP